MHDCWWGFAGKPEPGEQRQLKRLSKHRDAVEVPATSPGDSTLTATPAPAKKSNAGKIQRQAWSNSISCLSLHMSWSSAIRLSCAAKLILTFPKRSAEARSLSVSTLRKRMPQRSAAHRSCSSKPMQHFSTNIQAWSSLSQAAG